MFDNNYNNDYEKRQIFDAQYSETPIQNEMSYYPDSDLEPIAKKKKKGGGGWRAVAIFLLMIGVSSGSIFGYRYFEKEHDNLIENNSEITTTADDNTAVTDNSLSGFVDRVKEDLIGTATNPNTGLHIVKNARSEALSTPEVYDKVIPSVVGIRATFSMGSGTGTGIVMTSDGYIITNAHVVTYTYTESYGFMRGGEVTETASEISVILSDEDNTEYEAIIIGYDIESDLAVLKINETGLTPAEFGDSDNLLVGEDVIAIGNPLGFELFGTLSKGVVSALNREVTINDVEMTLIQTDTSINAGNSGGPLINCYGQVVGINSSKMSSNYTSSASIEGIAFAIPITDAKKVIDDLIKYGYVTGKPKLGITCKTVSDTMGTFFGVPVEGAQVVSVEAGGAADKAGVLIGDVITGIGDAKIASTEELTIEKNKYSAGDTITLQIFRDGEELELSLTLAEISVVNS